MIDNAPPIPLLCAPCLQVRHEDCQGALVFCECFVELLIEAEETPDARHQHG